MLCQIEEYNVDENSTRKAILKGKRKDKKSDGWQNESEKYK